MSGPWLTVRARLTLLYTGLFAVCGAIVVAITYALVAHLPTEGHGQNFSRDSVPAGIAARCQAEYPGVHPDKGLIAQCISYLEQQGAQDQRDLTLSHLLQYSLITVAVVIALAAMLGWIAAGRALRPVQQITAAARAASDHNLSARVAPTGPRDELRELAETFDDMIGRLQAAFEGQQRFIANASHELRTPLAVMRATIDVVLGNQDSTPDDLRGMGADIRAAADHAEHLIGALLILARNERGLTIREEVDLAAVAEDVLDATGLGGRRVHAALEPAVISGDLVLAERLIANLVDNAARYNLPAGDIWISTRTAAGSSQLTVANTGPVISQTDVGRIFEPFQRLTDRTSHDGFGLGLAIVASIAAVHGGTAVAYPRDDGGLSVTVTIPSAAAPAQAPTLRQPNDPVLQQKKSRSSFRRLTNRSLPDPAHGHGPSAWHGEAGGHLATRQWGGRSVLPKFIRDALGLLPGTKVDISPYGAGVQVVPAGRTARLVEEDGVLVSAGDTPVDDDVLFGLIDAGRR